MAEGAEHGRTLSSTSCLTDKKFDRAWKEHSPKLRRLCISMLQRSDPADADEAYGRASLKAYQEFPKICGRVRNLEAWLVRITYNICIDLFREKQARNEESFAAYEAGVDSPRLGCLTNQDDPEKALLQEERRAFLRGSIDELPPRLRHAVATFLQQGDYQASAHVLGITPANFRKRMQEARDLLRRRVRILRSSKTNPACTVPQGALSGEFLEATRGLRVVIGVNAQDPEPRMLSLPAVPSQVSEKRLEALEDYVRRHPGGWKKKYALGHLLLQIGRYREAVTRFSDLVAQRPRHLPSWLGLVNAHRLGGDRVAEREVYRQGIAAVHEAVGKIYLRGLLERSRRRWREAHRWLEATARLDPHSSTAWVTLALNWQDRGHPMQTSMAADRALKADPEDVAALLVGHDGLHLAGRPQEAEARNERVLKLDPENPVALERWLLYRLYCGEDHEDRAVRMRLRRLEQNAKLRVETCGALALQSLLVGDVVKAEQWIRDWIQRWPRLRQGWVEYARFQEAAGDGAEGLQTLAHSWTLYPSATREMEILALYLAVRLRDDAGAQKRIDTLLRDHGSCWLVQATTAWALSTLRLEPGRALSLSRSALDLQPQLAGAWVTHGRCLLRWENWQEAATALEEAWARLPEDDGHALAALTALGRVEIALRRGVGSSCEEWQRRAAERIVALRSSNPVEAALLFRHWSHLTKRRPPSDGMPLQGIPPQLWRWTERRLFDSLAGTDLMTTRR
jgi:RNA polymerase sigma-70 factor (ECF subfamily)